MVFSAVTPEDVLESLKNDGTVDAIRLKIMDQLKNNEELRNNTITMLEQSRVLSTPGADKQTKRELFEALGAELEIQALEEASKAVWELILKNDGLGKEINETIEKTFCQLNGCEEILLPLQPLHHHQPMSSPLQQPLPPQLHQHQPISSPLQQPLPPQLLHLPQQRHLSVAPLPLQHLPQQHLPLTPLPTSQMKHPPLAPLPQLPLQHIQQPSPSPSLHQQPQQLHQLLRPPLQHQHWPLQLQHSAPPLSSLHQQPMLSSLQQQPPLPQLLQRLPQQHHLPVARLQHLPPEPLPQLSLQHLPQQHLPLPPSQMQHPPLAPLAPLPRLPLQYQQPQQPLPSLYQRPHQLHELLRPPFQRQHWPRQLQHSPPPLSPLLEQPFIQLPPQPQSLLMQQQRPSPPPPPHQQLLLPPQSLTVDVQTNNHKGRKVGEKINNIKVIESSLRKRAFKDMSMQDAEVLEDGNAYIPKTVI